ncbi:MoaD/ThiS family protein [[Eubacterium] cellulosolvens]
MIRYYAGDFILSKIKIKFLGTLKWAAGKEQQEIEALESINVGELLERLAANSSRIKSILGDNIITNSRPNMIILINEVEIGLLEGLNTDLSDGDTLTLIPTAHGG